MTVTQQNFDSQSLFLEVIAALRALGTNQVAQNEIMKLENSVAEMMLVRATGTDGKEFHPPCQLVRCFPDDPEEISIVLSTLAKGERYHGGGGSFVEFWIERDKPSAVDDADTIDNCSHCGCKPEEVMTACTTGAGERGKPCDGEKA